MSSVVRPLPTLELPAAYLRIWRADGSVYVPDPDLLAGLDDVEIVPGGVAVLPTTGRAAVVDAAVRLGRRLLPSADGGARALVHPGRLRRRFGRGDDRMVDPVRDTLAEDLEATRPDLPAGAVAATGYAVARMRGKVGQESAGTFDPASGRRVPLVLILGEPMEESPIHVPEVLGRRLVVPRRSLAGGLEELLAGPALRLVGPMGCGKSHLLWHALKNGQPFHWLLATGDPLAAPCLAHQLARSLGVPVDAQVPSDDAFVEQLFDHLGTEGEDPWLVVDGEVRREEDRRFLASAMADAVAGSLASSRRLRLAVIERAGRTSPAEELPTLEVGPLGAAEEEDFAGRLFQGLDLKPKVEAALRASAAGHPLALEEGLLRLLHRGLLRRVYGSYFYAGGDEVEVEYSEQLVCEVEAEVRRLGDPLPLRMIAAVAEPIDDRHLLTACDLFDVELEHGWYKPFFDAGMLRRDDDSAQAMTFACPGYLQALRQTVSTDAGRSLRHAIGGVLADDSAGWRAYRLLAGTPEALPSLLDLSRDTHDTSDEANREELFNALWDEHRQHRARGGEAITELELLWNLLPLAHRLGMLGRLRAELERAVDLAGREGDAGSTDARRYVALAALLAELDQEQGRYREAEQGLRRALAASQGQTEQRRAALFIRLGALLSRQERWTEAQAVFSEMLKVAERSQASSLQATCHYHLGNLALQQKEIDQARSHHVHAAEIRERLGHTKPHGSSLVALGQVDLVEGDLPHALEHFAAAQEKLEAARVEDWELGPALIGRGRALRYLGDLVAAVKVLRRALEVGRRGDSAHEALARLALAAALLEQKRLDQALDEARRGHFAASLLSESALLGDAERLLGRCLMASTETESRHQAMDHLVNALEQHGRSRDLQALAEDRTWLLELAIADADVDGVFQHAAELRTLLDELPMPMIGETMNYRLFRGLTWLRDHDISVPEPVVYLRAAYQELMRKTMFLARDRRHVFLYQVREHQGILDAAAENDISIPVFQ